MVTVQPEVAGFQRVQLMSVWLLSPKGCPSAGASWGSTRVSLDEGCMRRVDSMVKQKLCKGSFTESLNCYKLAACTKFVQLPSWFRTTQPHPFPNQRELVSTGLQLDVPWRQYQIRSKSSLTVVEGRGWESNCDLTMVNRIACCRACDNAQTKIKVPPRSCAHCSLGVGGSGGGW